MGANCFVAARDKPLHYKTGHEVSTYRNVSRSPSWSSRGAMRGHIEDIKEISQQLSYHNSQNTISEVKTEVDVEGDGFSHKDPSTASRSSKWIKFIRNDGSRKVKSISSDQSTGNESSPERNGSPNSSVLPSISEKKPLNVIPSLSPTYNRDDPSSSKSSFILSSEPTSSRKPLNKISFLDCRNSILLSHDYISFNSENPISFDSKILESSRNSITFASPDLHLCGICAKLLNEKPPWSSLSVVAVLVCGHVYHAECLESSTPETEKYDPPCPVCTKSELKGRNKVSQIAVADVDADGDSSSSNHKKKAGKPPITRASSTRKSSIVPFLRKQFSMGSHQVHLKSANEKKTGESFLGKIQQR